MDEKTSDKMNGKPHSKAVKNEDPIIPVSEEDELPDIACDTCDIEFPSVKTYEAHLRGKKHHKMLNKIKLKKKATEYGNFDQGEEDDNVDELDESELSCDVCCKSFTGYVPYMSHLKGSAHKKNVKKQKMIDELKDMPEIQHQGDGETDSDEDGILPKTYAKCSTCNKVFYGPESFQQHIKSLTHKKKLSQQKIVKSLKSINGGNNEEDEMEAFMKCELCGKSFSGPVPYRIHMKSAVHQREVKKSEIIEQLKDFCFEDSDGVKCVCKDCKKQFSDPFAFKQHLTNNDHERKKVRFEISNFLADYPEMLMITPDTNSENEEFSSCCEQDSFWICRICHVSFSGPENARDHVKSRKHLSIKMELKKKKLLQEKKTQNSSSFVEPKDQNDCKVSMKTVPSNDGLNSSNPEGLNEEFELI